MDCFSGGSEPTIASPVPAATIAIAARYSILMAMVPPSVPRTNRTISEWFQSAVYPSPGTPACAPPGRHSHRAPIYSAPRGKFPQCVGSALQFVSPFHPNGVTIRSQGTKAPVKTLEARDRRSPLTTWRMSRIAKGSYCRARCSQKLALAQIAKSGGLQFRSEIASRARKRETCGRGGRQCWRFLYPNEASLCETALR
jgi:hypothetical protein